jgi:intracellular septation protein A
MTTAEPTTKHSTALRATWVTLRILIVLNWIFGALIFALLAVSFEAEEWTWRALGVGAVPGHEGVIAGMRAIMVIGIVGAPIAYVVFSRLLRMLESVRTGEPFTRENAGRLRTIAWALLGIESLHICVVAIASAVSTKEVPLRINGNFDLTGWLAILLLFVLAQVFLEGTRMRKDLEGTV